MAGMTSRRTPRRSRRSPWRCRCRRTPRPSSPLTALNSVSMPSSPILAGNWATDASSVPATMSGHLVGQRVEADQDDVLGGDAGVRDRGDGTQRRRSAGRVDRRHVRIAGQDVLGRGLALVLGAARSAALDDLDLGREIAQPLQHAVHARVERRQRRARPPGWRACRPARARRPATRRPARRPPGCRWRPPRSCPSRTAGRCPSARP